MQLCRCQQIKQLRVEADIGADPLWCNRCLSNLDIEEFPLTDELKKELAEWIHDYGTWINWETDGIVSNGVSLEQQHNERGAELTEKVKHALDGQYEVGFSPSTFAKKYSNV